MQTLIMEPLLHSWLSSSPNQKAKKAQDKMHNQGLETTVNQVPTKLSAFVSTLGKGKGFTAFRGMMATPEKRVFKRHAKIINTSARQDVNNKGCDNLICDNDSVPALHGSRAEACS